MSGNGNTTYFGVGLLVGAAVGAAIAILYAPRSGKETRAAIKEKAEEVSGKASGIIDEAKEKAKKIIDEARSKAAELKGREKERSLTTDGSE